VGLGSASNRLQAQIGGPRVQILGQQVPGTASKYVSSDPDYRYRQRRQIREFTRQGMA
jgi:hypothetical protein